MAPSADTRMHAHGLKPYRDRSACDIHFTALGRYVPGHLNTPIPGPVKRMETTMKQLFLLLCLASLCLPGPSFANDDIKLGIADLIFAIRTELVEAEKRLRDAGHSPLFVTRELELDIGFVVEKSGTAGANFDIRVLSVGGEGTYSSEDTQRVRLLFKTLVPDLKPVEVSEFQDILSTKTDVSGLVFRKRLVIDPSILFPPGTSPAPGTVLSRKEVVDALMNARETPYDSDDTSNIGWNQYLQQLRDYRNPAYDGLIRENIVLPMEVR